MRVERIVVFDEEVQTWDVTGMQVEHVPNPGLRVKTVIRLMGRDKWVSTLRGNIIKLDRVDPRDAAWG